MTSFGRGDDGAILAGVATRFPMQLGRFAVPRGSDMGIFMDDQDMLPISVAPPKPCRIPDADKSASLR